MSPRKRNQDQKQNRDDDKWVIPMLRLVADHPVIWDESENTSARKRAWSTVVAKLKHAGFQISESPSKRFVRLKVSYLKQRSGRITKNSKFFKYMTFLDVPAIGHADAQAQADQPKVVAASLLTDQVEEALADLFKSLPIEKTEQHQRYQALKEEYVNLSITEKNYIDEWHKINLQQEGTTDQARLNAASRKSRANGKLATAGLIKNKILFELGLLRNMIEARGDVGEKADDDQGQDPSLRDVVGPLQRVDSFQDTESLQAADLLGHKWSEGHDDTFLRQLFASKEPVSEEMNALKRRLYVLIKNGNEMQDTDESKSKTRRMSQNALVNNENVKLIKLEIDSAVKDIEMQQLRENVAALEDTVQSRETEIRRLNAEILQNAARGLNQDDPTMDKYFGVGQGVAATALPPAGESDFLQPDGVYLGQNNIVQDDMFDMEFLFHD